jgi:hypothetical protein
MRWSWLATAVIVRCEVMTVTEEEVGVKSKRESAKRKNGRKEKMRRRGIEEEEEEGEEPTLYPYWSFYKLTTLLKSHLSNTLALLLVFTALLKSQFTKHSAALLCSHLFSQHSKSQLHLKAQLYQTHPKSTHYMSPFLSESSYY